MTPDEVVQFYIKDNKSKFAVPNHSLCGFKRIHLKKEKARLQNLQLEIKL